MLGALVGHQFDQGMQAKIGGTVPGGDTPRVFFEATFEVMGHLAKVDGRVTEEEVRIARRIMHGMRLSPEQVKLAIDRFTVGKSPRYPLAVKLAELRRHIGRRRDLSRAFVEIQVQAAVGGGDIAQPKRQLLWEVARSFGIGRVELAQMEALIRAHIRQASGAKGALDIDAAYRVLGIEPAASDKDVKTAYRRLMNQHHPDKLVAKGLPESMVTLAEQKTHEIRSAYEQIKARRAFK